MTDPQSAPMGEQELIALAGRLAEQLENYASKQRQSRQNPIFMFSDAAKVLRMVALRAAASPRLAGDSAYGEYTPITVRASSAPAPSESAGKDEDDDTEYQEGYADGQNDANGTSTDTFKAVVAWLQKRGKVRWEDQPEGISAEDIIEGLNDLLPAPPTSHASQQRAADEKTGGAE